MKRLIMEFLGTFFLMLAIGFQNAFGIGLIFMAMVYVGRHVSGAHYNPSVSLAKLLHGNFNASSAGLYMVAQILGALACTALFFFVFNAPLGIAVPVETPMHILATIEFLLTFVFVWVVMTMTSRSAQGDHAGLISGLTLLACVALGGICNPAAAVGSLLFKVGSQAEMVNTQATIVAHVISPLIAGAVAAFVYKWFNPQD